VERSKTMHVFVHAVGALVGFVLAKTVLEKAKKL
jgi:hypothetical protein